MPEVIVIAHNIRSTHNIGSIFRTCEGFGVEQIVLSGYSPYPQMADDSRLPHIATKVSAQIHKTALGAETMVPYRYSAIPPLADLREKGFTIIGLEQDSRSIKLSQYEPPNRFVLLLGEEVMGISEELRDICDVLVEIPMSGAKESFNVSVAAGIALYGLTANT